VEFPEGNYAKDHRSCNHHWALGTCFAQADRIALTGTITDPTQE
jgi:hypothetical protein